MRIKSIFTFLLLFSVVLGFKEFIVWQQIIDGYYPGSILLYFLNVESHTARLVLMHPIVWLSDYLGLSRNLCFSYVVCLVYYLVVLSLERITYSLGINPKKLLPLIAFIILLLFFIMNGRNTWSFLGYSFWFMMYLRRDKTNILVLLGSGILSGLLLNVSSGVYSSFVIVNALFLVGHLLYWKAMDLKEFILVSSSTIPYSAIFVKGVLKNLDYYNGEISGLLSHGLGLVFTVLSPLELLSAVVILVTLSMFVLVIFKRRLAVLTFFGFQKVSIILGAAIGGLFGFSTMFGSLPLVLVFLSSEITASMKRKQVR